jgi:hypothetical protein
MTLDEIKQAIKQLSPEEFTELQAYIEFRRPHPLPPEERIRRMEAAAAFIRETMTPEQLEEAIAAMNAEYIEPWDEDEWTF